VHRRSASGGRGNEWIGPIAERVSDELCGRDELRAFLFDRRWPQGLSARCGGTGQRCAEPGAHYDASAAVADVDTAGDASTGQFR